MPTEAAFGCNLCEALCGLKVTLEGDRVLQVRGNPDDVISQGHICPKGVALKELYEDPDRLRQPMLRGADGAFEPIGWDEAMELAASKLRAIRDLHGKNAIALYAGNPSAHSHRAALGVQTLTTALGTQNRYDANSQDSAPRLFASAQMYGNPLMVPVPDVDRCDLLVLLGTNPAVSNGSMVVLGDARKRLRAIRERGGEIVIIDPRRSETAAWADQHLFIKPGGDAALLLALIHVAFTDGPLDRAEIDRVATGRRELEALAARFAPERVEGVTGVSAADIRALGRKLARTRRAAVYGRIGTCQNRFGPTASWLIDALNLVTGHLDTEGGSMFPTPAADGRPLGQYVVGDRFGKWRSRVRGLPEFLGALPSAVMAEEIETPGRGQIRALITVAGNPVMSVPNGPRLAKAIEGLEFVVAVDPYLNETTKRAHLVLPPRHVFETGSFEFLLLGFGVRNWVRYSPPIVPARAQSRDDWEILFELSVRYTTGSSLAGRVAQRQGASIPDRVMDALMLASRSGLSMKKLAAQPNGVDLGALKPGQLHKLPTWDGKVQLAPKPLADDVARLEQWVDSRRDGGLELIGRRDLRSNNSWMHNLPLLAKGPDRSRLFINPADARARGISEGDAVKIASRAGAVLTHAHVTDEVMTGVVSLPHGFGHQEVKESLRIAGSLEGSSANVLTDETFVEPVIGTSILNGVPVEVTRASEA